MKVKIKKLHKDAIIPKYAKNGDAGLDLTAVKGESDFENFYYSTGLVIEIPKGYVGLLFPRSSVCKKDMILSNCVGVIDSGYRGEISFVFKHIKGNFDNFYKAGDRIGQLIIMPYPEVEFEEVEELSESERGTGGYGSTGN